MKRKLWWQLILVIGTGLVAYVVCVLAWPPPQPDRILHLKSSHRPNDIQQIQFSPNGALLAFEMKASAIWNCWLVCRTSDGEHLAEGPGGNVVFSADSQTFAAFDANYIEMFNGATGVQLGRFRSEEYALGGIFFVPQEGLRLVSWAFPHAAVTIRRLNPPSDHKQIPAANIRSVEVVGRWAVLRFEKHGQIWDIVTAQRPAEFPEFSAKDRVSISADGKALLLSSKDRPAEFYDLRTGIVREIPLLMSRNFRPDLSPDGKLATGPSYELVEHQGPKWFEAIRSVFGLAAPPNEARAGVGLFDTKSGHQIALFERATLSCFSADGNTLAVLRRGVNAIEFWDLPLRSAVPYWIMVSVGVAIVVFFALRRVRRKRQPKVEPEKAAASLPEAVA